MKIIYGLPKSNFDILSSTYLYIAIFWSDL